MSEPRELELYVHIPFCARKCAYCDFLSAPAENGTQTAYVQALQKEIRDFPGKEEYLVSSVFFGGGTPSILPSGRITGLLRELKQEFAFAPDAEISIECNPGTVSVDKLTAYRRAGFNRLSLGLQSADNGELSLLGRIHTWEDFLESYQAARTAGFTNINIDLMSALPGQTAENWERTLQKVLPLAPEHISAYSLIIEEGTPFYEKYGEDVRRQKRGESPCALPSEDEERRMYSLTAQVLGGAGFRQYEISNYALPGRECRHNIGYWQGTEYAGFGLGAASLLFKARDEKDPAGCYLRRRNTEDLRAYLCGDMAGGGEELLTTRERMEEFMFLGLRMMKGVSASEFARRFGQSMDEVYGRVIRKMLQLGLLWQKQGRVGLTRRGIDVSNVVLAEFLLS